MEKTIDEKTLLEYYWKYFQLHTEQRSQMIGFYISIETVLGGGYFCLRQAECRNLWAELTISAMILLISITFMGLDYRTKSLIHHSENMLKNLEQHSGYKKCFWIIYSSENILETKKLKFTYSTWFNIQYCFLGGFGIVCAVITIVEMCK